MQSSCGKGFCSVGWLRDFGNLVLSLGGIGGFEHRKQEEFLIRE
jgi:hypothetical protein